MKLPWSIRARRETPVPEGPDEAAVPTIHVHRSPGLEAVLADRSRGDVCRVLDLGPAVPENLACLAGVAQRFQIVDALRESDDATTAIRTLERLAEENRNTFHLALLWDYLNYLPSDRGAALVAAVAALCRPDARCLAMVFTGETMPASPRRYRIVDESHLAYESTTDEVIGAPRLPPAAVERVFSGFSIEHAFVLQSGIREYVATRDLGGGDRPG